MVQSIELLFDEATEATLRSAWTTLADAGLPSQATNHSETNRPHVTVAVAQAGLEGAADVVRAVFAGWGIGSTGIPALVGAPVLFGGYRKRFVVARQIVPSRPLVTVHSAVARALGEAVPEVEIVEQTRPDRWTAHVTLARRVPADRLADALALLDLDPLDCRFAAARLWDGNRKTVTPLT